MLMFFGISKVRFVVLLQIEHGTCIDKKCSFTGTVSIRGRILAGTCHSAKMNKTIIVRRNYLHYIKKYQRYDVRDHFFHFLLCLYSFWRINNTKRFNVLKVTPAGSSSTGKKAFAGI
ncbi:hypothetical protein ACFX2I_025953 [Malus domestica]